MSFIIKTPFKNNEEIINELKLDLQRITNDNEMDIPITIENLCTWLCSAPQSIIYRINTLISNKEIILSSIKNALLKSHTQLPKIITFSEIPELIIINSWDESVKMNLNIYPNEVVVDAACGAAVLRGAHVYVPGIMGIPHGLKVGDTVSVFVDITNDCKKGLYKMYDSNKKIFIGNGIVKIPRENIFGHEIITSGIAVFMTAVISKVPQLNEKIVPKGHAILQNLPSIICSRILNPQSGEIVLDMCAAPGNKTTHIGALMNNKGILIALEKNKRKIEKLRANCTNFSLKNVHIFCTDSIKAVCDTFDKSILEGPPFFENSFDRILLDGPCSALGQRPQLRNTITISELRSYVSLQRKLFSSAVRLLKLGGTLVYSTCTITVAENEGIVAWALKTYPNLRLKSIPEKLRTLNFHDISPGYKVAGLTSKQSQTLCRFGPENDTVGFFIACFVKTV